MREFIVALTLSIGLLLLPGCSQNDDGGTTGGSGQLMGECAPIASVRPFSQAFLPSGELENAEIAISPNCDFTIRSESTGVLTGKITPNAPRWDGQVQTDACKTGTLKFDLYSKRVRVNSCHGQEYDN